MVTIRGLSNPWRAGHNSSGARWDIISSSDGADVLNRALAGVPAKDTSGEADFRFGKAARFTLTTPEAPVNPGVTIIWPPDDPIQDPQDGIVIIDYDLVDWAAEKVKIEQEGEPDNYVVFLRGTKYLMRHRSNGTYIRLNLPSSIKPSDVTDLT